MFGFLNHSLLLRAGLAMGVVTVLAVAGMASAVYVARSTHGEAGAVNLAGSLRMQCYRLTAVLEAGQRLGPGFSDEVVQLSREFEQRLHNSLLTRVIGGTNRTSLRDSYDRIGADWRDRILPLIERYTEMLATATDDAAMEEMRIGFRHSIAGYVADIDMLVRLLEEDAESRIHMLGLMQGISLLLTLTVAIMTLYLLHTDVISPLRDMLNYAARAGRGDFSVRVAHVGDDELGLLGRAFNTMTSDLSKMYGELEQRVEQKTEELTQRNRSLELLYHASQHLSAAPVVETTYREMLEEISQLLGDSITLCLRDESQGRVYRVASSDALPPMCDKTSCQVCLGNGETHFLKQTDTGSEQRILSVPVRDQEHDYGVLLIEHRSSTPLEPWQIQLLETLGKHIGISVGVTRRVTQRRRLALLDERSVIARELHDSLAQSLSYLRIQVTRLSMLRGSDAGEQAVNEVLGELKEGVGAAYRQLRELLTTFRLQMDGRGLASALADTVAEFNGRSDVDIGLDNRMEGSPFSVNEEIHVLQIIREALANVMYHSHATQATVRLYKTQENEYVVDIEDDGIGIPPQAKRTHHYGLAIMRERSSSLGGELSIEPRSSKGTRVRLRFNPRGNQQSNHPEFEQA